MENCRFPYLPHPTVCEVVRVGISEEVYIIIKSENGWRKKEKTRIR